MKDNKIATVIVLYNPDLDRLYENINAVIRQTDCVILVDNNSSNIEQIKKMYSSNSKIHFIFNDKNEGIAKALNQGIELCSEGYEWVLTLDQDSVVPDTMIFEYKKYLSLKNVGILTPLICDRNQKIKYNPKSEYEYLDRCITSGSLTNIAVWDKCGKFDERMFIDVVDFEYCYRITWAGYKIIRINSVQLLHECGKIREIRILGYPIKIFNHSALRKYYFARNWAYVKKKHSKKIPIIFIVKQYIVLIGKILLFENRKFFKIKAVIQGLIDGLNLKMGECIREI